MDFSQNHKMEQQKGVERFLMDTVEMVEALKSFECRYQREAVEAALENPEAVSLHLIAILKEVVADPEHIFDEVPEEGVRLDYIYALILLGIFREEKAHDVIVDLASMPMPLADEILGDSITEDLHLALYQTCGGKMGRLKELATNDRADVFCREAALRALGYAFLDGVLSRDAYLSFLRSELEKEVDPDESNPDVFTYFDMLASCAYGIYPEELMDVIREGFEAGKMEGEMTDYAMFEELFRLNDRDGFLSKEKKRFEKEATQSIHDKMEDWACFREDGGQELTPREKALLLSLAKKDDLNFPDPFGEEGVFEPSEVPLFQKPKKRNKKKAKQSKASRKANRRKKKK